MKKTTNYNLNLPELADQYNIKYPNENFEKIDAELKNNADAIDKESIARTEETKNLKEETTNIKENYAKIADITNGTIKPSKVANNVTNASGEELATTDGTVANSDSLTTKALYIETSSNYKNEDTTGLSSGYNISDAPRPNEHFSVLTLKGNADTRFSQLALSADSADSDMYFRTTNEGKNKYSEWQKILTNESGWDFTGGIIIEDVSTNFNNLVNYGTYTFRTPYGTVFENAPTGFEGLGTLQVYEGYEDGVVSQNLQSYNNGKRFYRYKDGSGWNPWKVFTPLDTKNNMKSMSGSFDASTGELTINLD